MSKLSTCVFVYMMLAITIVHKIALDIRHTVRAMEECIYICKRSLHLRQHLVYRRYQ